MPELPDLIYMQERLAPLVAGRTIANLEVTNPIVLRVAVPQGAEQALAGARIDTVERHGPFLAVHTDRCELVFHFMLTGRLQHTRAKGRKIAHQAFCIDLDDGSLLRYGDQKQMGRVYILPPGDYSAVPGYTTQGVDITGEQFDVATFRKLARGVRSQTRVFLMDQRKLSALGNAYADEVLFAARIHPKTRTNTIDEEGLDRLHAAIRSVIADSVEYIRARAEPIEKKIRDHVKVRNKKGQPCPRCGTTIRREQVHGYDTFFCPQCQPAPDGLFIDWNARPDRPQA